MFVPRSAEHNRALPRETARDCESSTHARMAAEPSLTTRSGRVQAPWRKARVSSKPLNPMVVTKVSEFRRHAVLLFADLCEFTALNEASDPEDVALVLHGLRNTVEAVVRAHGGAVNEWRGDGVLCTFGLPRASENDARHAVETALSMHAAVRGLERHLPVPKGFEIRLHSGLHAGLVFASEREAAQGYDLVGDAVNTAARLCERAGRDELWATEETIEGLKELFETEPPELLVLKGKKSMVQARRIVRRSEVRDRFGASQRRGLTKLIGRETALWTLNQRLSAALGGSLTVLNVVGSPGVGKTRLLEEFRARVAGGVSVVTGRCENAPNAKPLKPFIEVLWQALGLQAQSTKAQIIEALSAHVRQFQPAGAAHEAALSRLLGLEAMPALSANPELVQQSFVDALGDVLSHLSVERPLVLMLDDWQWADDASRQLLGGLMRLLQRAPVLLLIGSRDADDPLLAGHPAVTLQPFTREESAEVIAALLPVALDLGLKQAIHERSGGNPLFLEELCRALPNAAPAGDEDLVGGKVPPTLRGIIQVRVERLPEAVAQVLRAAAVIGSEFSLGVLQRVTGISVLLPLLEQLVQGDLIHAVDSESTFRFKHSTTRDVVYESVRLPERRRLHAAAVLALEESARATGLPEPHEELGYHCAGAGDHQRAVRFAELAGDEAAISSSLDRARQQYRIALDALEKLDLNPELERLWIALVSKWAAASLYSPAREHLKIIERAGARALRLLDIAAAARAEYWLGWFCYALGEQELAIEHCRGALEKARSAGDQRLAAQLLLNLGQSLAAAGKYDEALTHLEAGLDAKRRTSQAGRAKPASERRTPLGAPYALACKALLHADRGEFPRAYECIDEGLQTLGQIGHAVEGSCLGLLGMVQLLQGRWADGLSTAMRAQATAERVNGPYVVAMSKTVSGYARWMLERDPDSLAELLHAVRWLEERGIGLYISYNYGYLADALASAGQPEAARDYAMRALARKTVDRIGESAAYRTLARLAVQGHVPGCATDFLEQARQSAAARKSVRELALIDLDLAKMAGERAFPMGVEAKLRELSHVFQGMGMDFYAREAASVLA